MRRMSQHPGQGLTDALTAEVLRRAMERVNGGKESRPTIRLVIVDDHPYLRAGVRRVLEQERDMEIVGEVSDGLQALPRIAREEPDVVLMDMNLPGSNGLHVTKRIRDGLPDTHVIILTAYHDEIQLLHSLRAGASACLPKEVAPRDLLWTIREASRGRVIVDQRSMSPAEARSWARQLLGRMGVPRSDLSIRLRPITERQMEILQAIACGLSNEEIAEQLGVSRHTIKNQVYTIYRKLGVRDRTQAVLYALRYGWARMPRVAEHDQTPLAGKRA